jgi:hypothetical protein
MVSAVHHLPPPTLPCPVDRDVRRKSAWYSLKKENLAHLIVDLIVSIWSQDRFLLVPRIERLVFTHCKDTQMHSQLEWFDGYFLGEKHVVFLRS